jgi:hypothetical protein
MRGPFALVRPPASPLPSRRVSRSGAHIAGAAAAAPQASHLIAMTACAVGTYTTSIVPWIVAGVVKVVALVMESIYGAVGHRTAYIVTIVISHWGAFCMFAWAMFLASELEEALANEPRCAVAEPAAAAGLRGYGSYAAGGGMEQRRGAESTAWGDTMRKVLSGLGRILRPVPVLGRLLGDVEKSQKRQHAGV